MQQQPQQPQQPQQAPVYRCCEACGAAFTSLQAKNDHILACRGPALAAVHARVRAARAAIMAVFQDDAEVAGSQHHVPKAVKQEHDPLLAEMQAWLADPTGYSSTGRARRVRSDRTLSVLRQVHQHTQRRCANQTHTTRICQDVLCLLKTAESLGFPFRLTTLCDDVVTAAILRRLAATTKGPARMYNLASACHKAAMFLHATRRVEAPSILLSETLLSEYNRLRYVTHEHEQPPITLTWFSFCSESSRCPQLPHSLQISSSSSQSSSSTACRRPRPQVPLCTTHSPTWASCWSRF